MNEALREQQLEKITSERARHIYESLCEACEKREGGMEDADQLLVGDVAYEEQLKEQLMDDINKRGLGGMVSNGRQRYYQDNKSIAHLRSTCESQRKQLNELRLTPAGRKAASVEIGDEFDRFPD